MKEVFGRPLEGYSLADLHMHTKGSVDVRKGMSSEEAVLSAERSNLQAIAITNHDEFESVNQAINFAAKEGLKVQVIPGMEITTSDGHLIGLYLDSPVPRKMGMMDSIKFIHRQGGLAIVPHPFFGIINSIKLETLQEIMQNDNPDLYFDGFEIHNAGVEERVRHRPDHKNTNIDAQNFFKFNGAKLGAPIGSSDGHRMTVGRGLTAFKGNLKTAITGKQTLAIMLEQDDQLQLVLRAIELFGEKRVLGNHTLEELKKRFDKV